MCEISERRKNAFISVNFLYWTYLHLDTDVSRYCRQSEVEPASIQYHRVYIVCTFSCVLILYVLLIFLLLYSRDPSILFTS